MGGCLDRTNVYSEQRTSQVVRRKEVAMGKGGTRDNRGIDLRSRIYTSGVPIRGGRGGMLLLFGGPEKVIYDAGRRFSRAAMASCLSCPLHICPINELSGRSRNLLLLAGRKSLIGGVVHTKGCRRGRCFIAIGGPISERFIQEVDGKIPILSAIAEPYEIIRAKRYDFQVVLARKLGQRVHEVYQCLKCRMRGLGEVEVVGLALSKVERNRCERVATRR